MESVRILKFGMLAAVAVVGSLIFGATALIGTPSFDPMRGALWLTVSAGSAWIVFGLALWAATRKPILDLAEASLLSMAIGECVLVTGAVLDWLMVSSGVYAHLDPVWWNAGIVAVSNVAMAISITKSLGRFGVPAWKSAALWLVGLDGVGAITFTVFYRLLLGGHS